MDWTVGGFPPTARTALPSQESYVSLLCLGQNCGYLHVQHMFAPPLLGNLTPAAIADSELLPKQFLVGYDIQCSVFMYNTVQYSTVQRVHLKGGHQYVICNVVCACVQLYFYVQTRYLSI
jgi:hypothetical protein